MIAPGTRFQQLAVNSVNEQTLASLAVSGGSFYLRTAEHLYKIR